MANFTREAIKKTFLALLKERPLSDITVKDLVASCGINRNTFYYHYQDLPALLEETIQEVTEAFIRDYPSVTTIVECFDAVIAFTTQHKSEIMHIYRSMSRDVFEQNLMDICEYFVGNYADEVLDAETISLQDKKSIVDFYKCVCFGLTVDWLNSGMAASYHQSIRRIFLLKKDHITEIARLLQDQV